MSLASSFDWTAFEIPFSGGTIVAKEKGHGSQLLICFHGFGENKDAFDRLFLQIPGDWIILSLDLPLFGDSQWQDPNTVIDHHTWTELIQHIHMRHPQVDWHLLGFSMGGKVALAFQQLLETPARSLILMAPDGIARHPLHAFVSRTQLGTWLIRQVVYHPGPILRLTEWAFRLGWIDPFIHLFMNDNFAEKRWRKRMYLCLTLYEGFQIDWHKVQKKNTPSDTHWYLIWGKKDMTFGRKAAHRLKRIIPSTALYELESGHMLLWDQFGQVRNLIHSMLFTSSNSSQIPPTE